jgi:hypothetical protein
MLQEEKWFAVSNDETCAVLMCTDYCVVECNVMFSQQQQEMEGNHKNLTPLKLFHGGNGGVRSSI